MAEKLPVLYIVVPCYNEEKAIDITAPLFVGKIEELVLNKKISGDSKVLFVDDGSRDKTWQKICDLSSDSHIKGIRLSRNRGHQNALLAGLSEAVDKCDITISLDCDGQDDTNAIDKMVEEYFSGAEIVYGVRNDRRIDSFFKRNTAEMFYKFLRLMGADVVFNHADFRLVSSKALSEFLKFKEVNLYLRGMFPLVGFKSTCVYYERHERIAGESHYSFSKMLKLAFDGITSLSARPISFIFNLGIFVTVISAITGIVLGVSALCGNAVNTAAIVCICIFFIGGVQLTALGILGEYIGKIYLETKQRPRFIVSERTDKDL